MESCLLENQGTKELSFCFRQNLILSVENIICYLPWQRFLGARGQLGAPRKLTPWASFPIPSGWRHGSQPPSHLISFFSSFHRCCTCSPLTVTHCGRALPRHPGLSPADLRRGPRAGKGEEKQEKKLGWEREWGKGGGAESPCPTFQLQPCAAWRGRLLEGREKGRPMTPHPLRD